MRCVVKLTEHHGQYRITLPRELLQGTGLVNTELVVLDGSGWKEIIIREYHGKGKEKGGIQEDQT